ncbi:acyl-CoA Delta-9 desaturase-like [Chrysoperla carnea]|uniref:acyl-CoA Delta-9 desaturase-like n=1 Tax=Chrysoperla carnea TaxID=189513 RepID=UPI001D05DB8B|nr:acyl-CoA Delta-9 desaturase-like [Chrysoperla carnea]
MCKGFGGRIQDKISCVLQELKKRLIKLLWMPIILFSSLHIAAIYATYLIFTSAKIWTTIFALFLYQVGTFGITGGAHRLWSHRAYKAKWPLQVILIICQTIAFQAPVIVWVRDHRIHHKFSDTSADPHNANRGFFFSHVGWMMCEKHPDVIEEGKLIDISDLKKDPIIQFQKRYYAILMVLLCIVLPTLIPWYFWNETLLNGFLIAGLWKYAVTLNATWLINSAGHIWGTRPYDKMKKPTEHLITSIIASGEGWHNYHHTFPWDYKASELGHGRINTTTFLIDCFAKIGWAYDLKSVSNDIIKNRVLKYGDGTHPIIHQETIEDSNSTSDKTRNILNDVYSEILDEY